MNHANVEDLVTASHILAIGRARWARPHQRAPSGQPAALLDVAFSRTGIGHARGHHGIRPRFKRHRPTGSIAFPRTLYSRGNLQGPARRFPVIHSHSPTVIPFSISQTRLQPVFNGAAFLSPSVPVFDIRKIAGMTDLLIGTGELGKALSASLGEGGVVLLRGHGNAVVRRNSAAGCLPSHSNGAQRPAAASGDDARWAVDLHGAGRSRKGERPLRTRRNSNRSYLGTLEGTKPATMTIPMSLEHLCKDCRDLKVSPRMLVLLASDNSVFPQSSLVLLRTGDMKFYRRSDQN